MVRHTGNFPAEKLGLNIAGDLIAALRYAAVKRSATQTEILEGALRGFLTPAEMSEGRKIATAKRKGDAS